MEPNQNIANLQALEQMPTAELEQLLQLYTAEVISMDEDTVIVISDILATRNSGSEESQRAAAASFETFKNRVVLEAVKTPANQTPQKKAFVISWRPIFRCVATLLVLFVLGGIVPSAMGVENIFIVLGKWTDEMFWYSDKPEYSDKVKYDLNELEIIVEAACKVNSVVPKWLPEGFNLTSTEMQSNSDCTNVIAIFGNDDREIYFLCSAVFDGTKTYYEKDTTDVTEYRYHGQPFNIMTNADNLYCTWAFDNIECQIWGDLTEEELHRMIGSIYEDKEELS